jgi:hypothetical protein
MTGEEIRGLRAACCRRPAASLLAVLRNISDGTAAGYGSNSGSRLHAVHGTQWGIILAPNRMKSARNRNSTANPSFTAKVCFFWNAMSVSLRRPP